ncbi:ABC transporter ATP-binding protein/permease [Staphylococcus sp. H16/1A]|uniref:ABC transporter ATP-binding protein/permease n=2 Tax=Staphylococcus canis TaxID=2724942 RepID=A0ABS0T5H1_9STAP|nr:ABC transporter ATP-binding protein/permease [Staphylococcus canis]MBI5974004.1 ABC transporter ATP-binding protein/permease [Staphylococcus canis]
MKPFYKYPAMMLGISMILAIAVVTQNILIGKLLNHLLFNVKTNWLLLIIVLSFALFIRATMSFLNDFTGERLSYRVRVMIRKQLLHQYSKGNVGARLTTATHTLSEMLPFYRVYIPQVFKSMMIPLAIIITMVFIHLPTALIMIVTAPFIPVFYIVFGLKTRDDAKDQMTFLNHFSARFLTLTKGLETLKIFNRTVQAENTVYKESTQFRDKTMIILKSAFLSSLMLEFISMLGIGIIALEVGLSLIVFKSITFEIAAIAVIMAPEFYNAIKDLGQAFHTGKESEGASEVVNEMLQNNVKYASLLTVDNTQTALIRVKDLNFKYDESEQWQLKNINFNINKGDHIALVGPSGSGKSTLVQLILGELRPYSGTVIYNAHDLRIGYLAQYPYIFNATIAENVAMFHKVEESEIQRVLSEVQLDHVVRQLERGIHTYIGEGGEMLSGGEMRRIELARLLIMKPEFLVLDEPFTGLDIDTEMIIQHVLSKHFKETTRLTIAHRQQTIRDATRRIYLQNGEIKSDDTQIDVSLS